MDPRVKDPVEQTRALLSFFGITSFSQLNKPHVRPRSASRRPKKRAVIPCPPG